MRNIPMLNQIQYTKTSKTKTEFNFMEKIKVETEETHTQMEHSRDTQSIKVNY